MKKFFFSLNSVKEYKDKLLENLKLEHAAILMEIAQQEQVIQALEMEEYQLNEEVNEKNANGITAFELINYQRYLKVLQQDIRSEYDKLANLKKKEMKKREELIEMKKEAASYEKLREKKLQEYHFLETKAQEQFIEEFVSNKKYARR